MKPIQFPQDELAHNHAIEWWYWNGHLTDENGKKYAYMHCLFKADTKKVKLPFLSKHPFKTLFFAHSTFIDISAKKATPKVDYTVLASKDSFTKSLLYVNYINPLFVIDGYVNNVIEQKSKNAYHIKNEEIDLNLVSVKKPLLEDGTGYVDLQTKGSYYYSLPRLKTEGTININGKHLKVKGTSWMDHQWADTGYSKKDKWTWFSIQLTNKIDIVCFEFDDGKNKMYLATISYSNNKQSSTHEVILTQKGNIWESPVTKAKYPLSWKIEIPSKNILLELDAISKSNEVLFGIINYWEGSMNIKGSINGKKVKGQGFMELVGYPMNRSNLTIYRKKAEKLVGNTFSAMKNKGLNVVNGIIKKKR